MKENVAHFPKTKFISESNISSFLSYTNIITKFFKDNNFILNQALFSSTRSFEDILENALTITKFTFDVLISNSDFQKKILFPINKNHKGLYSNMFDWNYVAMHCLISTYDALFQLEYSSFCSFSNASSYFIQDSFTRQSSLGKYINEVSSYISTKRIQSLKKQLCIANMSEFFCFSCNETISKKKKKPLLISEIPLITSIISGSLLPLYTGNPDKDFSSGSNHKLQKRLEIFKAQKTRHSFDNYDLLLPIPNDSQLYFFPGYYPMDDLFMIDQTSHTMNAFDYYINYKLESIFNLETYYTIYNLFITNFHDMNITTTCPKTKDKKAILSMKDLSIIAECPSILLRASILQSAIENLLPPNCNQKNFKLLNYITAPNETHAIELESVLNPIALSKDYILSEKNINQWIQGLHNKCEYINHFLIPICEWLFFSQIYSQKRPSWNNSQEAFLNLFRKYALSGYNLLILPKSDFKPKYDIENPNTNESPDTLSQEEINLLKYPSIKYQNNKMDLIICLQELKKHSINRSIPLENIDWQLAPTEFSKLSSKL